MARRSSRKKVRRNPAIGTPQLVLIGGAAALGYMAWRSRGNQSARPPVLSDPGDWMYITEPEIPYPIMDRPIRQYSPSTGRTRYMNPMDPSGGWIEGPRLQPGLVWAN